MCSRKFDFTVYGFYSYLSDSGFSFIIKDISPHNARAFRLESRFGVLRDGRSLDRSNYCLESGDDAQSVREACDVPLFEEE
jgi:hypothetical protein